MTKKEWLSRATNLDIEIKALEVAKQTAFAVADYQSPLFTERVQTGQTNSSESKVIKYIDYVKQIEDMQDKLFVVKQEVINAINQLPNSVERAILIDRFINGKQLDEVAESSGYEVSSLKKKIPILVQKINIGT